MVKLHKDNKYISEGSFGQILAIKDGVEKIPINKTIGMDYLLEMDIMSSLSNVGIVQMKRKKLKDKNKISYVMERAPQDLENYIKSHEHKIIPFDEIKIIMVDIMLGMYNLHHNNILHNDLKPSNILIFNKDDEHYAKLCDFGFCQHRYPNVESIHDVVTVNYRSPEIFNHQSYNQCSDIWSLGCIFYDLLTCTYFNNIKSNEDQDNDSLFFNNILGVLPLESYDEKYMKKLIKKCKYINPKDAKKLLNMKRLKWEECLTKNKYLSLDENNKDQCLKYVCEILTGMLHINTRKRKNIKYWLFHPLFSDQLDKINKKLYVIENHNPYDNRNNYVFKNVEREYYMDEAIRLYEEETTIPIDCLFMSLSMADTSIYYLYDKMNDKSKKCKSNYIIIFYTCLHICLKYTYPWYNIIELTDYIPKKYEKIFNTKSYLNWEKIIIRDILNYNIYRKSPLFYINKDYNKDDINHLFLFYSGNKTVYNKLNTTFDYYELFEDKYKIRSTKTTLTKNLI